MREKKVKKEKPVRSSRTEPAPPTAKRRGTYRVGDASVDRLLDATAELLQEKGYYGTGLNEILKRSGAPRGSLYHHFPGGKDELVIRSLQKSADQLLADVSSETGSVDLYGLIKYFRKRLVESDFKKGCPIAAVAQEVGGDHVDIRKACSAIYAGWEKRIASTLIGKDASERARLMLCQLEGSLLLCKTHHDPSYLSSVLRLL